MAIVNRGEPAMRLLRAVREWNRMRADDLRAIALHTDPDRDALYVREADAAFNLGPAMFLDEHDRDEDGRPQRKSRYLDYDRLREALVRTRADAAWVGWGFVAEHAAFAELCAELGVVFIGPPPAAMRRLGDKIGSKLLAESAGVPVAPWSGGAVASVDEAHAQAARIGYPLLIKATAGGGGRGIRFVNEGEQLAAAFASATAEARKAFGDGTVFLEARIGAARHIEVQVLADAHGTVWPVGVRDCTAQRCNQKVIEEAPSPVLGAEAATALCEAAVRIARSAGYVNAGTVEFLYEPAGGRFFFMEMNTRLQVEHPVTEATTGLDLVRLQLAVARGERLPAAPPKARGHAIEVRLCAEDPARNFAPAPGRVACFRPALTPGVRTDAGLREGDTIPVEFDSMVAKVIAHGETREEARARLMTALSDGLLVVEGGTTNRAFLLRLLGHPDFVAGTFDTKWIDRLMTAGPEEVEPAAACAALLATAVTLHETQLEDEAQNFFVAAARGRPALTAAERRPIELRLGGASYELRVATLEPGAFRVEVDGRRLDLRLEHDGPYECRLCYDTPAGVRRHRILSVAAGTDHLVEVDGFALRVSRDAGGVLRAPAPGLVLALHVADGARVRAGERLLALEAMKMELPVVAPFAGRVRQILVGKSVQVAAGEPLLVLEPEADAAEAAPAAPRLVFPAGPAGAEDAPAEPARAFRQTLRELRRVLLGFDATDAAVGELLARFAAAPADPAAAGAGAPESVHAQPAGFAAVADLLRLYLDVEALFGKRTPEGVAPGPRLTHEQWLHLYLREYRAEGKGLPEDEVALLRRALGHYGVASLAGTPRLRDALVWIYRSHQGRARKDRVVTAVLQACLDRPAWRAAASTPEFRELLDRVVAMREGQDGYTGVCEWAHQARYALFEGRALAERRAAAFARVDQALAALEAEPLSADRAALMASIVTTPFALMGHLGRAFHAGAPAPRALILEAMTRRYYRTHPLGDPCALEVGGHVYLMGTWGDHDPATVIVAGVGAAELDAGLAGFGQVAAQLPPEARVLADLYVAMPGAPAECADFAALVARLGAAPPDPRLARLCVNLVHPDGAVQCFTFIAQGGRLVEDAMLRGFHPTMEERLELWRLRGFDLTRVATAEDLYLFHARARENARDERFIAVAEVRDLHPVRDAAGRLVALPEIEHALLQAFNAIRAQQTKRDARRRLHWNRVTVFVRPPVLARRDEIGAIARRLDAAGQHLGLEKVAFRARLHEDAAQVPRDTVVSLSNRTGHRLDMRIGPPKNEPLRVLDDYKLKVVRARQRGLTYVYETVKMLAPPEPTGDFPAGEFVEHDLGSNGDSHALVPVAGRPYGLNTANVVVGVVRSFTAKHPEGMARVLLLGDGTREMGALAEPECRRIIAALDLAERLGVPLDWFPISSGAKIAMDSGTENLDWTAATLRRIIEFTQAGGEINVVVDGINVGAQSYWNAEATMLMHTRGCLIMTARGTMMLTGKRALDYSGGVSAEDNLGIGGVERVMGPNGQAQYFAADLGEACRLLMTYYEHTYVAPGERAPRRRPTADPLDRDVRLAPYGSPDGAFATIGDLLGDEHNPGRKKPFDVRTLMRAVIDADALPLERWGMQRDAEVAVVWDAHLGGYPVTLVGIESKPLPRVGAVPADGPDTWSGGTLFPLGSKKVARALNAASGNRPAVIVANLSGFDGSPESLRALQLEYGAEIGRAVVNFRGPLVFCVVARYHGGAYVVFSRRLNPNLRSLALTGAYASVIGGAPAAAVVFPEEARALALKDPRVVEAEQRLKAAGRPQPQLQQELADLIARVRLEKQGEVAARFDAVHTVKRALEVGSLDGIIEPWALRPALVEAVAMGLAAQEEAPAAPAYQKYRTASTPSTVVSSVPAARD
ncbi:MAG TPA: carboxyl transferase domain-containing protein [Polyangia bacterium]